MRTKKKVIAYWLQKQIKKQPLTDTGLLVLVVLVFGFVLLSIVKFYRFNNNPERPGTPSNSFEVRTNL